MLQLASKKVRNGIKFNLRGKNLYLSLQNLKRSKTNLVPRNKVFININLSNYNLHVCSLGKITLILKLL